VHGLRRKDHRRLNRPARDGGAAGRICAPVRRRGQPLRIRRALRHDRLHDPGRPQPTLRAARRVVGAWTRRVYATRTLSLQVAGLIGSRLRRGCVSSSRTSGRLAKTGRVDACEAVQRVDPEQSDKDRGLARRSAFRPWAGSQVRPKQRLPTIWRRIPSRLSRYTGTSRRLTGHLARVDGDHFTASQVWMDRVAREI
jgi:hypothetical protein